MDVRDDPSPLTCTHASRAILVRLSSLVILFISLFILIECTQTSQEMDGDQEESEDECDFDPLSFLPSLNETISQQENCPEVSGVPTRPQALQ